MSDFVIEQTRCTPQIIVDSKEGKIEISGISNPINAAEVFEPVLKKLEEYVDDPPDNTVINMKLVSFNSSTSKWLIYLFRKLVQVGRYENKKLVINWYYDKNDSDSYESGEGYECIIKNNSRKINPNAVEFYYIEFDELPPR